MEKKVTYEIKEDMAQAIREILSKIRYCDFTQKYKLTPTQEVLIHDYLDGVEQIEGEEISSN